MDRCLTASEVAERLGCSVATVCRRGQRGDLGAVSRGQRGELLIRAEAVSAWLRQKGGVKRTDDFTREELLALAVLARRPLGVQAAREIARAAQVSPTTASKVLRTLTERGLVERVSESSLKEPSGMRHVWKARVLDAPWAQIRERVMEVQLPVLHRARQRPRRLPRRLWYLFWQSDPSRIDLGEAGVLVADRILRSNDPEAVGWMAKALPGDDIRRAALGRGMERGAKNLGLALARAAA